MNICPQISSCFEKELNLIADDLMKDQEIENKIINCYYRKFADFDKNKNKYPPFAKFDDNDEESILNK